MKKLIVLICMVLCVAVIGSVLALAVFDAPDVSGSVSTDGHLYLTLNSTSGVDVKLDPGVPTIIPIDLAVSQKGVDGWGTTVFGKLTITVTSDAAAGESLDNITIGYYADEAATTAITDENVADNVFETSNIKESKTVYVRILLDSKVNETQLEAAGGTLKCAFVSYTAEPQA